MSNVSALAAAQTSPLIQRPMGARKPQMDDRVYDPILDPALNPALRGDTVTSTNGMEEITVTAKKPADDGSLSFWDFLDLINPLQHIPIVNTIYRDLTGDTIKTPIQLIGSTIVGGPIGFATAMVDSIIEEATGTDIGGHAMAMLKGERPQPTNAPVNSGAETQLAAAEEFVPEDYHTAPVQSVQSNIPAVALASSSTRPQTAAAPMATKDVAAMKQASARYAQQMVLAAQPQAQTQNPAARGKTPTESEAFVQTAQIAAQANVFPTFKRTGGGGGATSGVQTQQEAAAKAATAQAAVTQAQSGGRFMPVNRNSAMIAPARSEGSTTTEPAELKARSRFAPGPINGSAAALAPASVAVATASRKVPTPPVATPTPASARPVSPQEAYSYGRQAAGSESPAEVPPWFDSAMMNAIDKYKAMQQVQ